MNIQIASDIHLDHLQRYFPGYRVIEPAPGADVLVLAGDIHAGKHAIETFSDWPVPVVYVFGNHEFYGYELISLRRNIAAAAKGTNIIVLDDTTTVLGGVRFVGATLWTDYKLMSPRVSQAQAMRAADIGLNDRNCILMNTGAFKAHDAALLHSNSRKFLQRELKTHFEGRTVVVTHHGCDARSTAGRFAGNELNPAFMSGMGEMVGAADLWIHGHVHDSFDYPVHGAGRVGRVIANPRGYAENSRSANHPDELRWENPHFEPELVIEI